MALPVPAQDGQAPLTGYLTRSFRYSQPSLVYSQALDGAADRADITAMTPAGREGPAPGEAPRPGRKSSVQPPGHLTR